MKTGYKSVSLFFFHTSYVGVYVINRIRAAGQAAVVRPFIRTSVLSGKNLNVGQNAKTFPTETSESSGHFTKERVNEEIFTGFVYLGGGGDIHINLGYLLSTATFASKQKHIFI